MLRTIPVAADRLILISTGHVNPINVWTETPEGRRTPTDTQQVDEETGEPLWVVDVLPADQDRGEVLAVQVRAKVMPVLDRFGPVVFRDLEAKVSKGRDGNIRLYWSASGAESARSGMTRPAEPKAA